MENQAETMTVKEARKKLKENNYRVENGNVESFVSLKNINKVYPNGVQAVYDFNLDVDKHDFVVLVGPSGCGKSTTLRMIAGLEDITSGYLYIDKVLANYLESKNRDISMVFQSYALYPQMTVFDNIAFPLKVRKYNLPLKVSYGIVYNQLVSLKSKILDGTASKECEDSKNHQLNKGPLASYVASRLNIEDETALLVLQLCGNKHIPTPEEYEMVLNETLIKRDNEVNKLKKKNYSITPNYEVLDYNGEKVMHMAYLSHQEIREKVFAAADSLDLGPYLDRRPKELSGGQMQRVALGRAIVRNAKLFLMDEPLSNLDAKLRVAMRSEIVSLHERIGATTIYVTHDQTEAMTMATKIVVMSKGWVQQVGAPTEVYQKPKNIFVATFIGSPAMNINSGTYNNGVVTLPDGFKIDLGPDFIKKHDNFYRNKIEDCKQMLKRGDISIELKAQSIVAETIELLSDYEDKHEKILSNLHELQGILSSLEKETKNNYLNACQQAIDFTNNNNKLTSQVKHAFLILRETLKNVETITKADIAKLHSAQVFSQNSTVDAKTTLTYGKRKHEWFWTRWHKALLAKRAAKSKGYQIENSTKYIETLKLDYGNALKGPHPVEFGIRPEHIHLDEEYKKDCKSDTFTITTGVVELLGSELLIHFIWNGKEMIGKISTGTLVKPHTQIALCFNKEKVNIFDPNSGDTIM